MKTLKELQKPIIFLVISLALIGAAYMLLIPPKSKLLKGLQENLNKVENEIKRDKEVEKITKLPSVEEQRKWEAMKEKMVRAPKALNFPKLMEELGKQTLANNIPDAAFSNLRSPPPPQPKGTTVKRSDLLIKISFHSEYRDLALFLKGLDDLSQWVVIELLQVKKAFPLISAELDVRPIISD